MKTNKLQLLHTTWKSLTRISVQKFLSKHWTKYFKAGAILKAYCVWRDLWRKFEQPQVRIMHVVIFIALIAAKKTTEIFWVIFKFQMSLSTCTATDKSSPDNYNQPNFARPQNSHQAQICMWNISFSLLFMLLLEQPNVHWH